VRLNPPDDSLPRGTLTIWQELNAIVYEMRVRPPRAPAALLVIRCYENQEIRASITKVP
jgi:hypothetical protein